GLFSWPLSLSLLRAQRFESAAKMDSCLLASERSLRDTDEACLPTFRDCAGSREFPGCRTFGHSKMQFDPGGRVIARVFFATYPPIHAAVHKARRHIGREQKVVEPHAFIGGPTLALVIPKRPERPVRTQLP